MFLALKRFLYRTRWFLRSYLIAVVYVLYELLGRKCGWHRQLRRAELPLQDGRNAIITGGSRGIGLEIVRYLLEYGYNVVIGSSSSFENRKNLENTLKAEYPEASVEVWYLDLASLQTVKNFTQKFLSSGKQLHLLINNAGIMFVPDEITEDGFEKHFEVNYLSHAFLTLLLLPRLEESGTKEKKSRIINSTSCIHYACKLDLEDLQSRSNYSEYYAYMQSKLAQVMFTYSLHQYLQAKGSNITVNCAHPGVVNTDLMSSAVWWVSYIGSIFFKTAKQGAETVVYAALSPEMEGVGGKYLEECAITKSSKSSQDKVTQQALWHKTLCFLQPWAEKDLLALYGSTASSSSPTVPVITENI